MKYLALLLIILLTSVSSFAQAPAAISGPSSVCFGLTITLTDDSTGGTWSSGSTAVATINTATGVLLGALPGTSTITYTTSGGIVTTIVTVLPPPPPITGTFTLCPGGSSSLTDAITGGSWSSSNTGIAFVGPTSGNVAGVTAGTANISYTVPSGCAATVVATVNPGPSAHSVTGGGGYCPGGAGVPIGLNGSDVGVTYQLYLGGVTVGPSVAGTGSPLPFGLQTAAGTYTVIGTSSTTSCSGIMTGSATVSINPLPPLFGISTGGSYCSGGVEPHVILTNSASGINYTLFDAMTAVAAIPGSGGLLDFGPHTAGIYTIVATNPTTACSRNMSGVDTITVNPLPSLHSITGGGGYCVGSGGVHIGLNGSNTGISYQLYSGGPIELPVPGTGFALDFGLITGAGYYFIMATNTSTGCTDTMTGSATVTANSLPPICTITGGSYCSGGPGVAVSLSCSALGINYSLYNGSVQSPAVAGTGLPISFGFITAPGTYSVIAVNAATMCMDTSSTSATVTINPTPTISGPSAVCAGSFITEFAPGFTGGTWSTPGTAVVTISVSTGLITGVSAGTATITFTTPLGCVATKVVTVNVAPSPISGTTSVCVGATTTLSPTGGVWSSSILSIATISPSTGILTGVAPGTSTITFSLGSGCITAGIITVNPSPAAITGAGSLCGGGSTNDTTTLHDAVSGGTWASANTGIATVSSAGFVTAISPGATAISYTISLGCSVTKTVTANSLPAVYTLLGGGSYCAGGTGVDISLSGSVVGTSYSVFTGSLAGAPMAGTGGPLDLGMDTLPGICSVFAINSNGCSTFMSGADTITVNPLPTAYSVTGTGSYCSSATGVNIGLSGSDGSISYQLYDGASPVGSPVSGTGSSIDFGLHSAGTYTVVAANMSTGCIANMSGSATITAVPLPASYTVAGGGNYCSGGSGVHIGLSGSTSGINYQLLNTSAPVGSLVAGTGSAIDFGPQTATGTYTVIAINATYGCTDDMAGSATAGIYSLPVAYTVIGGGSYCAGGAGVSIGLNSSNSGVNYNLYDGPTLISTLAGTSSPLDFGSEVLGGTYTVVAVNTSTTCANNMTGSASVTINPSVTPSVTITAADGDTVCQGTTATYTAAYINGGTTPTYTWIVNGVVSSTVSTLTYSPANGDVVYLALVSSAACASPVTAISPDIVMDVFTLPAITGGSSVCSGSDLPLTDTVGGIWSSSNPAVATIATIGGATGVLSGVGPGTATITYTLGTGCSVSASFLVHPLPVVTATYSAATCGGAYTLSASGGVSYSWAPSAGMSCAACAVTDVVPPATTSYYVTGTDANGCSDTAGVTVDGNRISGYISTGSTGALDVWLIQFNPSDSSLIAIDSTTTCLSGGAPYYEFDDKPAGSYLVKAYAPGGTPGASGYIPTYGLSSPHWNTASSVTHTSAADTLHINMIYGTVPSGPGFIGGLISSGAGKGTLGDVPAQGMLVYLADAASGQVLTYTYTDADGAYSFSNLAYYSYIIYPEQYNYHTTASTFISLSSSLDSATGVDFKRHTTAKTITPVAGITGTNSLIASQNEIQVYPNPASGNLNIQWNGLQTGSAPVVITDMLGREVYKSAINMNAESGKTQIDVSTLKSGIYLISVKADDMEYNGKLMVQ